MGQYRLNDPAFDLDEIKIKGWIIQSRDKCKGYDTRRN